MKEQKLPIQVYLDSDDYSKLSDPKHLEQEPKKKAVLNFLKECIKREIIEIRFSANIFSELVHLTDAARSHAIKRVELLSELTRGKAIQDSTTLYPQEALYLAIHNSPMPASKAFINDGIWFANAVINKEEATEFRNEIIKPYKKMVAEHPGNRRERKKYERQLFRGEFLTREIAEQIINGNQNITLQGRNETFVLSDLIDKNAIVGFLSGEYDEERFIYQSYKKLLSPQILLRHICDYEPEVRKTLINLIRGTGEDFKNHAETLIKVCEEITEQGISLGLSVSKIEAIQRKEIGRAFSTIRDNRLKSFYQRLHKEIALHGISEETWNERVENSPVGALKASDLLLILSHGYSTKAVYDKHLKVSHSDMPDLMNAAYIPYVDVIRLDKRTINFIEEIKRKHDIGDAALVKRPEDLPEAIIKLAPEAAIIWEEAAHTL